jgi:hypothetical protein
VGTGVAVVRPLVIVAPNSVAVGKNQEAAITGIAVLEETGNTSGENFAVILSDANGDLSATGTGVSGSGTTTLTLAGSLSQVNSDLATLTDTDGTIPSDTITINASDSIGGHATPATIAVTVNGPPVIAATPTATVVQNQATWIGGVNISESGNTSGGETFMVILSDAHGDLRATGVGVSGSGTTSLTITGSLAEVNSALGLLTDTDASTASDTITIDASDSFGNSAAAKTIAIGVTTPTLTTLVSFNGPNGGLPKSGVIADAAGNLFGTTTFGGAYGYGTVFELVNNGGSSYTPTTLLSFSGPDNLPYPVYSRVGYYLNAGLTADAAGDLFGTTTFGGAYGYGTVFEQQF